MQMMVTHDKESDFLKVIPPKFKVVKGPFDDEDETVCHVVIEGEKKDFDKDELMDIPGWRGEESLEIPD